MAVKREFGERQPSELGGRAVQQNQAEAASEKPEDTENVDNLVSSFLAELTDLSSKIRQNGKPGTDPGQKTGSNNFKMPPQLRLEVDTASGSAVDLGSIDEEIEKSLTELESLKSERSSRQASAPTEKQPEPKAPAESAPAEPAAPAATSLPAETEEQAWNRLELFRTSISSPKIIRRPIKAIWAAVLVVAAIIAIFYIFKNENAPSGLGQKALSEPAKPDETPAAGTAAALPVNSESISALANSKKSGKPANTRNAGNSERSKTGRVSSRAANADETKSPPKDKNGPSGNGAESKIPPEAPLTVPAAAKGAGNEESQRTSTPSTTVASSAPEKVSQVIAPAAPQPKPDPVIPASPAKVPSENGSTAAPVVASPRESTPAEPKPAPAGVADSAAQPKARIPVAAEAIKTVSPEYPLIARSQRVSGKVDVEADINDKGDVVRARAVSGPVLLRNAAEQALMRWKFKPASVEGVNTPSKARVTVTFNLK